MLCNCAEGLHFSAFHFTSFSVGVNPYIFLYLRGLTLHVRKYLCMCLSYSNSFSPIITALQADVHQRRLKEELQLLKQGVERRKGEVQTQLELVTKREQEHKKRQGSLHSWLSTREQKMRSTTKVNSSICIVT